MRILVTGAAGYLGSVLCPTLLAAGHSVIAVDSFLYANHLSLVACCHHAAFTLHAGDVRDPRFMTPLIKQADAIVPLAALVGAPLCERRPNDAISTNLHAIEWLAAAASREQLICYPNTNSSYGSMPPGQNEPLDEDSPRRPLSLYAETKDKAERTVLQYDNSVVFRLATVFGTSPRMRADLLVNDLTLRAVKDRSVTLFQPHARRNYVHVRDVADASLWAIDTLGQDHPAHVYRVFNLGHDGSNCTKLELCERIARHVPGFTWHVGDGVDPDKRDYVVSNSRLRAAGFEARRSLDDGITELIKLYQSFPVTPWGNV